jgi:uncharacterized cupredoxin-like copper-binding protein
MQASEVVGTSEPGDLRGPRRPLRDEVRGMRTTLLVAGGVVVAAAVAVGIAFATYDSGSGAPKGDIQASTVEYAIHMPHTLGTGHHIIGYTNNGKAGHEIVMFLTPLPANALPLNADGDVNEDSSQLVSVADSGDALAPGHSKSFTTVDLKPGHYVAVCNLPGHYKLGMHLDFTVP